MLDLFGNRKAGEEKNMRKTSTRRANAKLKPLNLKYTLERHNIRAAEFVPHGIYRSMLSKIINHRYWPPGKNQQELKRIIEDVLRAKGCCAEEILGIWNDDYEPEAERAQPRIPLANHAWERKLVDKGFFLVKKDPNMSRRILCKSPNCKQWHYLESRIITTSRSVKDLIKRRIDCLCENPRIIHANGKMNLRDQRKLIAAGFVLIKRDARKRVIRKKYKDNDRCWSVLEGPFESQAKLDRRFKEFLENEYVIEIEA